MASFCGFNKIAKIHKLALTTNCKACFSTRSLATLSTAAHQFTRLLNTKTTPERDLGYSTNTRNPLDSYLKPQITKFSTKSEQASTNTTLDDFRAREQQKDEEYTKQQEADPGPKNQEKIDQIRLTILNAALPFVATHGWTKKALVQGAESCGYPGVVHGMFPSGAMDLIKHFYGKCNDELVAQMTEETKNGEIKPADPVEFTIRLTKARLQMIEPYIAQWPQAIAIMSLPQNVPTALAQLLTLVDDICYYSGDRSVEFEWYMHRIGLATIYKMTEIFMLQDSSIDHQETWTFLRRRMEEASYVQSFLSQSEGITNNMQKGFTSAFETARNILGLNYQRR